MTQTAKLAKPNDNELKEQSRALLENLWTGIELDLNSRIATARKINLFQTYYTEGELPFSLEILKGDSALRGLSVGKSKARARVYFPQNTRAALNRFGSAQEFI